MTCVRERDGLPAVLDEERAWLFAEGALPRTEKEEIEAHLGQCIACHELADRAQRERLAEALGLPAAETSPAAWSARLKELLPGSLTLEPPGAPFAARLARLRDHLASYLVLEPSVALGATPISKEPCPGLRAKIYLEGEKVVVRLTSEDAMYDGVRARLVTPDAAGDWGEFWPEDGSRIAELSLQRSSIRTDGAVQIEVAEKD